MKDSLVEGLSATRRVVVDRARTIDFLGDALRVYGTPSMARDIEESCRRLVGDHLDQGEDTIGARIEIDHIGATLLDCWVEITAKIVGIDGRRISLEVDVRDALEQVGKVRHVRFIIDKERQKQRLEAKAAKLKNAGGVC